jgi:hypothetical protein
VRLAGIAMDRGAVCAALADADAHPLLVAAFRASLAQGAPGRR